MGQKFDQKSAEEFLVKKEELIAQVDTYDADKSASVFEDYFNANNLVNGEASGWYNEMDNLRFIYNLMDKIGEKPENLKPLLKSISESNLYMGVINYIIAAEFIPVADCLVMTAKDMPTEKDEFYAALFLKNENVDGPAYEAFICQLCDRGRSIDKIMKLMLNGLDKYCSDDFGFGQDILKMMISKNGGNAQTLAKICYLLGQYDFSNETVELSYKLINEKIDAMNLNDELYALSRIFEALRRSMQYRAARSTFVVMIYELQKAKAPDYAKIIVTTAREGMPTVPAGDIDKALYILGDKLYLPSNFMGLYTILSNNDFDKRKKLLKGVDEEPEVLAKVIEIADNVDKSNVLYVRMANQLVKDLAQIVKGADVLKLEKGVKKTMGAAFEKSRAQDVFSK